MAAPLPYLSNAWVQRAKKKVGSWPGLATLINGVTISILMVVTDRQDLEAEAIYVRFEAGALERVDSGDRVGLEAKYDDADFTVWASYETFVQIHNGDLTERVAVLSGKVGVKGSMRQALGLLRAVEGLNQILRKVPAAY